jgi:hypothetical protein
MTESKQAGSPGTLSKFRVERQVQEAVAFKFIRELSTDSPRVNLNPKKGGQKNANN